MAYQSDRSSRRPDPITLGTVLELIPGNRDHPTWINGELTLLVVASESKSSRSGAPYVSAELEDTDSGRRIQATFFGRKAFPPAGALVALSGQGLQLTEYNGQPQLTGSAKTQVNVVSHQSARKAPASNAGNARQAPAQGRQDGSAPVPGQTVGMAMKEAIGLARERWDARDYSSPRFMQDVYELAGDLIRVSRLLEKGKLAASAKDRERDEIDGDPPDDPYQEQEPEPSRVTAPSSTAPNANRQPPAQYDPAPIDPEDVPF